MQQPATRNLPQFLKNDSFKIDRSYYRR